jgi:hypothetical protein
MVWQPEPFADAEGAADPLVGGGFVADGDAVVSDLPAGRTLDATCLGVGSAGNAAPGSVATGAGAAAVVAEGLTLADNEGATGGTTVVADDTGRAAAAVPLREEEFIASTTPPVARSATAALIAQARRFVAARGVGRARFSSGTLSLDTGCAVVLPGNLAVALRATWAIGVSAAACSVAA